MQAQEAGADAPADWKRRKKAKLLHFTFGTAKPWCVAATLHERSYNSVFLRVENDFRGRLGRPHGQSPDGCAWLFRVEAQTRAVARARLSRVQNNTAIPCAGVLATFRRYRFDRSACFAALLREPVRLRPPLEGAPSLQSRGGSASTGRPLSFLVGGVMDIPFSGHLPLRPLVS